MKFCVVGAGAWGTAFALHLARGGRAVALVPRRPEQAAAIGSARENREYLPGVPVPASVEVCAGLAEGLAGANVILLACPVQTLRETADHIRAALPAGAAPRPAAVPSAPRAARGEPRGEPAYHPRPPPPAGAAPRLVVSLAKGLELGSH